MNTQSVRVREDAEKRFKRKTEEVALASRAAADYAAAHQGALANMARLKALRMERDSVGTPVPAAAIPPAGPLVTKRVRPATSAPRQKRATTRARATSRPPM